MLLLLLLLVATPTDETTCEEIKLRFLRRHTTARFSARSAGLGSKNIRRNMLSRRIAYHLSGLVTLVNLGLCGHWNGLAFFCGGTVEFLCHKDRSAHPLCDDSVYFVSIEAHSGPAHRSAGQPGPPQGICGSISASSIIRARALARIHSLVAIARKVRSMCRSEEFEGATKNPPVTISITTGKTI